MALATITFQRAHVVTADRYQRFPPAGICAYLPAANAQRPAAAHRSLPTAALAKAAVGSTVGFEEAIARTLER
jgi:hypothetical protein